MVPPKRKAKQARKVAKAKKPATKKSTARKPAASRPVAKQAAAKKGAKAKRPVRPRARRVPRIITLKPLKSVSVGDLIRVPPSPAASVQGHGLVGRAGAHGAEAIVGVVCSIRNIGNGSLVTQTRGPLTGYMLELVHDQTFLPHYGSDRNTGGTRGPEDIRENPVLNRLRGALQELARRGQTISTAGGGFAEGPLGSLLDGWRVVKVRAEVVESAE